MEWLLSGEFVAIDLETTGFDPVGDRIIEIGATRFTRAGVIDTFRTFVDPGRSIPIEVQELTSIRESDVAGAITQTHALALLAAYAGSRPVVGQNIAFDLGFLAAAGLELAGPSFDTWELASVLLPLSTRLDLGTLAASLGVTLTNAHRALADAEATRDVFLALLDRAERLPRATLLDLANFAQSAGWGAAPIFAEAAVRAPITGDDGERRVETLALPVRIAIAPAPLVPREETRTVTDDDVERLFEAVAQLVPGFERREGQVGMARAVADAIGQGRRLAVEAGTGTGKSLAYLLPALLHALRNRDRVLVSTHTLNLQEQLARHDIPLAAAAAEAVEGAPAGSVRAAVLKGRANYLCLERWAETRLSSGPRGLAEARLHARIATWLPETETGDVGELYLPGDERNAWRTLAADSNDCLSRRCSFVREGSCFLLRARQRAAASHVVIVNHALLLANAALDTDVLPPARHLVIDEAHRIEDVATQQFGRSTSTRELRALLDDLGGDEGPAGRLRAATRLDPAPLSPAAGLAVAAEAVQVAARRARERVPALERAVRSYSEERLEQEGTTEGDVVLGRSRSSHPTWDEVADCAVELELALLDGYRRLVDARNAAAALAPSSAPGLERITVELGRASDALLDTRGTLHEVIERSDPESIRWLRAADGDVRLSIAPLEVGERLATGLIDERHSVIATSATLSAGESFEFTLSRLGMEDAAAVSIPSPFDYRRAVLVLVATDVPEPDSYGHLEALHETLAMAVEAAGGRTLALFTSRSGVRQAAGALKSVLRPSSIGVLAQGVDGSPERLLRTLVERPRSLVLGTAAFWEGVDVRGDALSQVAMARLPFPVPTDPIHAGRAELYEDPFAEYALPHALLRFRQGFGRLIRGSDERGVFLVLDRRILTRRYGEAFLEALPDCEVRRLPTHAIPRAVAEWLER